MASPNNYLYGYDVYINDFKLPSSTFYLTTQNKTAQNGIKQMIFSPPATIVKWSDGDKTVVKATDKDDYDPIFGFLMAYFQKHSGMTKTQVGKFCDSIIEEFGKQQEKKNKKKESKTIECIEEPCINHKHICCFTCDEYKNCSSTCEITECENYE